MKTNFYAYTTLQWPVKIDSDFFLRSLLQWYLTVYNSIQIQKPQSYVSSNLWHTHPGSDEGTCSDDTTLSNTVIYIYNEDICNRSKIGVE